MDGDNDLSLMVFAVLSAAVLVMWLFLELIR